MKNASRKISYLLRHNPEDLVMDKKGWVKSNDLITKLGITMSELKSIVENNDKKRFAFNDDESKIRASQGHSEKLGLKVDYKEVQFPEFYFHGTATVNVDSIMKNGLHSQSRSHVHLSKNEQTAEQVGLRHSKDIKILLIDGKQMKRDGLKIYQSDNGVILVDEVAPRYIKIFKQWRD
jgi:putative RNA 2'-phosphotransferase